MEGIERTVHILASVAVDSVEEVVAAVEVAGDKMVDAVVVAVVVVVDDVFQLVLVRVRENQNTQVVQAECVMTTVVDTESLDDKVAVRLEQEQGVEKLHEAAPEGTERQGADPERNSSLKQRMLVEQHKEQHK